MHAEQYKPVTLYKNHGNNAEYACGAFYGVEATPNNRSHKLGGDVLGFQVKSARATVCEGLDFSAYLAEDAADSFIYVTKSFKGYVMSRSEYAEFINQFAAPALSSKKNGEKPVLRLRHESRKMLEWLAAATA